MATYGYIRTSRQKTSSASGSDPETQDLQLRKAGVDREYIYRDVGVSGTIGTSSRRGWHGLDRKLSAWDVLVVAAIDRIGRRWQDTMHAAMDLQSRGVRVRSLDDTEARWTAYLDAEPDSVEAFQGHLLMLFASWIADQEAASLRPAHQGWVGASPSPGQDPGKSSKASAG